MKRARFIIPVLTLVIISLSVIHVIVANRLSTTGIDLYEMQAELTKYKKQNIILHEQVLKLSSLDTIASRAAELGFVEPKQNIVIEGQVPLAKR
jgi:cell division protein FtsL